MESKVDGSRDAVGVVSASIDALNAHATSLIGQFLSDEFTLYSPTFPNGLRGREANLEDVGHDLAAFPDFHFKIDRITGSGDWVCVEGILSGTNTGPITLLNGKVIKATGHLLDLPKVLTHRVKDGRIAETHEYYDQALVDRQLGIRRRSTDRMSTIGVAGIVLIGTAGLLSIFHVGVVADRELFSSFIVGIWFISSSLYFLRKLAKH